MAMIIRAPAKVQATAYLCMCTSNGPRGEDGVLKTPALNGVLKRGFWGRGLFSLLLLVLVLQKKALLKSSVTFGRGGDGWSTSCSSTSTIFVDSDLVTRGGSAPV